MSTCAKYYIKTGGISVLYRTLWRESARGEQPHSERRVFSGRLEFSWQAFNATNSVRYDVRGAQPSLSYDPTQFGKYLSTLTTPRFMQFALRFVF